MLGCDSVSAAASSSLKIRVVVSDSEALRRNRYLGMLGCDSVSAAASSSFKIEGVVSVSVALLQAVRLKLG